MSILIISFGLLMLLTGILLIVNPDIIFKVLKEHSDSLGLHVSAVVVRR